MATLKFNQFFREAINKTFAGKIEDFDHFKALSIARDKGAMFDARCFSIPAAEVANYFIWRGQDATRNAIQMLGQTHFSHTELQKKNTDMIQEMLWQKGINFNDMPVEFKRGVCCYRRTIDVNGAARNEWYLDKECPIFTKDRNYIERFLSKED